MKLKAGEEKCGTCNGKGWTIWLYPDYGPSESHSCTSCNGTGKVKRRDTI